MAEAATDMDHGIGLARRRAAGEPLQYLTGIAGFRHLELAIGPGALVPRPETEQVAQRALDLLPPDGTLVDIGTGAGPIALSVAQERPDATVFATDISSDALAWAEKNRARLGSTVELLQGDLFEPLPSTLRASVDVVVSNPPYVGEDERSALPRDVVDHEPHVALFADDGLSIVKKLVVEARYWLKAGGWLVLEISERHPMEVETALTDAGYSTVFIEQDLSGRARISSGCWRA